MRRLTAAAAPRGDTGGMLLSDISDHDLERLSGCHRTTVARWRRAGVLPDNVARMLEILYLGKLDHWPMWKGWVLAHDGLLVAPDGVYMVTPGQVWAGSMRDQELAAHRAEWRRQKAQAEQMLIDGDEALAAIRLARLV